MVEKMEAMLAMVCTVRDYHFMCWLAWCLLRVELHWNDEVVFRIIKRLGAILYNGAANFKWFSKCIALEQQLAGQRCESTPNQVRADLQGYCATEMYLKNFSRGIICFVPLRLLDTELENSSSVVVIMSSSDYCSAGTSSDRAAVFDRRNLHATWVKACCKLETGTPRKVLIKESWNCTAINRAKNESITGNQN